MEGVTLPRRRRGKLIGRAFRRLCGHWPHRFWLFSTADQRPEAATLGCISSSTLLRYTLFRPTLCSSRTKQDSSFRANIQTEYMGDYR